MTCKTAKQPCDILKMIHEGRTMVKRSKLQLLTSKFENILMEENETFMEFYIKLNDIVNSMWGLGESMPEAITCSKILRSLPDRFNSVTSIEKHRDPETMKGYELVGFPLSPT